MKPVYVTGNPNKAKRFSEMLGLDIELVVADLEEIQSLDSRIVITHKAKVAYEKIKRPVIVEDTTVVFTALGGLPGPFIKWFLDELKSEGLCRMLDGKTRKAIAGSSIAYYDGETLEVFSREIAGSIAEAPRGEGGWGWDCIFIADGTHKTNAEMDPEEYVRMYRSVKPFDELADFLKNMM
jgi:non-canonical purine NTP pyrophosphatase (RdgB/HAM1 family)